LGRVRFCPCPCSGIWHGPNQTLSLVGSGRVFCKFHYTDPTRPDMSAPATRSPTKSGPYQIPPYGPTDFVCDPTRPDPRTKSVHVEIERTSLRLDKVRGLIGDPSGPWVWSGRVRVVEFRNDTTRPDQRQSPIGKLGHLHDASRPDWLHAAKLGRLTLDEFWTHAFPCGCSQWSSRTLFRKLEFANRSSV